MKKKIAFFSGYYLPHTGGIERYTYNLSKQLTKNGYEVIIVTTKYNEDLEWIEKTNEATIYRLPIYKLFSSRYPIIKKNKKYRELIKALEKENIDSIILNTRFQLTSYIGAKFAIKNNIPMCMIEHGSGHFTVYNKVLDYFGHIYEHILTNRIKKMVKDFYGVSNKCNEWLKHFGIEAKGVFYNCIDDEDYKKYKEKKINRDNRIMISYVGRLIKEKGIYELINSYRILKQKYPNIQLYIAGDGPELGEVILKSKDLNILGKLDHDEVMDLLDKTDILVNPSNYSEGMPTTILEAGLMKCAIVTTNVGGTKEVICDETMGKICKFEINDIKNKVEELIINEEKRKKIQENIHNRVIEKFTWKLAAKKLIDTIEYKEV